MTEKHGGKREGAGRKPKHGKRMIQKTVRLPREWIDTISSQYGSFQTAIEEIIKSHLNKS